MTITKSRPPEIKSNWWRLVLYFLLVIIGAVIGYIPIFVFNSQLLSLPRDEFNKAFDTPLMGIAAVLAMAAGVLFATYFMVTQIEYRSLRSVRLTINLSNLFTVAHLHSLSFLFLHCLVKHCR